MLHGGALLAVEIERGVQAGPRKESGADDPDDVSAI
jgi:hypothetical protein